MYKFKVHATYHFVNLKYINTQKNVTPKQVRLQMFFLLEMKVYKNSIHKIKPRLCKDFYKLLISVANTYALYYNIIFDW